MFQNQLRLCFNVIFSHQYETNCVQKNAALRAAIFTWVKFIVFVLNWILVGFSPPQAIFSFLSISKTKSEWISPHLEWNLNRKIWKYIAKKHWFTVLYQMGCNFVLHSNWENKAILIYMTIVTQFVPKRGASSSELTSMETRPFLF